MKHLIFLFALLVASPAYALNFSAVGAVNMSEPKVAGTEYNSANGFGYGGLIEFGLVPFFAMEIGALSLPRNYEYSTVVPTISTVNVKMRMLQVPVIFKAYLGNIVSVGLGGYWAKYKNAIAYDTTYPSGNTSTSTQTLNQANHSQTDFGLATSLAFYLPLAPGAKILIDGRYTIGVKDNNTGSGTTTYNDMQLLAGLRLGF